MKQSRILHLCEAPASHRFDFLCVSWCDKPTAWWRSKSLWQWRSSFQWSNVGDQFSDLCSCSCRNRLTPNTRFCIWSGICVSSDVRQRALLRLCSHSANLPRWIDSRFSKQQSRALRRLSKTDSGSQDCYQGGAWTWCWPQNEGWRV